MELNVQSIPALDQVVPSEGCLYAYLCPSPELPFHDLQEPEKCWCFPSMELFYDEDGSIGVVFVDHKWSQ